MVSEVPNDCPICRISLWVVALTQNIQRQTNVVKDVRAEVNAILVHKNDFHNLTQFYMVFARTNLWNCPKLIGIKLNYDNGVLDFRNSKSPTGQCNILNNIIQPMTKESVC